MTPDPATFVAAAERIADERDAVRGLVALIVHTARRRFGVWSR